MLNLKLVAEPIGADVVAMQAKRSYSPGFNPDAVAMQAKRSYTPGFEIVAMQAKRSYSPGFTAEGGQQSRMAI